MEEEEEVIETEDLSTLDQSPDPLEEVEEMIEKEGQEDLDQDLIQDTEDHIAEVLTEEQKATAMELAETAEREALLHRK